MLKPVSVFAQLSGIGGLSLPVARCGFVWISGNAHMLPKVEDEHMNFQASISQVAMGHTRSEHPNPTTKIGSKMGGEFTCPRNGIRKRF